MHLHDIPESPLACSPSSLARPLLGLQWQERHRSPLLVAEMLQRSSRCSRCSVLPALRRCSLGSVQRTAPWYRQRSAVQGSDAPRELRHTSRAAPQPLPRLRSALSVRPRCRSRLRSGRPLTSGARRAAARGLRRPPAAPVPPASAIPRPRRPAAVPRSGCAGWAPRARRSCAPAGGGAWRGCAARAVVGRCGSDGEIFSPAAPWCAAAFPGAGGSGRDPRGASPGATGCRRTGGTGGSRTCWRSNAGCTPCRRCACRGVRGRRRPSGPGRWGTAPRGPPAAMPTPPASCWQPPPGSWLRLPWLQSRKVWICWRLPLAEQSAASAPPLAVLSQNSAVTRTGKVSVARAPTGRRSHLESRQQDSMRAGPAGYG